MATHAGEPTRSATQTLARELADVGVAPVDDALLAEIDHALHLRPHEGALPRFGAILAPALVDGMRGWGTRVEFENQRRLRELTDGVTSFLVHTQDGSYLTVRGDAATEGQLARLCSDHDARVVRLLPDGALEVMTAGRIWIRRQARWWQHATAATHHEALVAARLVPADLTQVLREVLDLAVHTLSPERIGATIVVLPDWDRTGCEGSLHDGGSTPLLRVEDRDLDAPIANLLRQHDGAALVSPDGALWWVGAELAAAPPGSPPPNGGMRHRSAARFSALRPDSVVVVVSHDGRVAIYVEGEDVTAVGGKASC